MAGRSRSGRRRPAPAGRVLRPRRRRSAGRGAARRPRRPERAMSSARATSCVVPVRGSTRRQPVRVRRMPCASGGPSTSPGGASRDSSAGRSSNMLKRFAAFDVPCRAHSSTASAAASSSSSSRCRSSGSNPFRTWSLKPRSGAPIPTRSRLNFSVPSSPITERSPLWPPALPPSRNRSLPNGRAKSSVTTRRSTSGACSRARTFRTASPESFIQVSGLTSVRSIPRNRPIATADASRVAALARPAGSIGQPVEDHPADVVARLRVLVARIPEADNDFQGGSEQRAGPAGRVGAIQPKRARIPSGGPAAMVAATPGLNLPGPTGPMTL